MPTPPLNPATYPTQRRGESGPEAAASAGLVSSVFGRIGAVVAVLGDYAASLITNNSTVTGATVADALDWLASHAGAVTSVFGRAGVVVAVSGDYTSSLITDSSNLPGTTVTDALNYLAQASAAVAGGATPALPFATNRYQVLTLDQNATPTVTIPPAGVESYLELVQSGAGAFTVTWPASVDWTDALPPILTTTTSKRDLLKFVSNGTRLRGFAVLMNF